LREDGEGIGGGVAKEEATGKVIKGMLFFREPGPAIERVEESEEMVGPGGKNPVGGSDVQWGDRVWGGRMDHGIGEEDVRE
jgi:hypothetical protein